MPHRHSSDQDIMINALGNALAGLHRAKNDLNDAAKRISEGEVDAESLIDAKTAATDFKAQAKALKKISKIEDEVLDLLA